MVDGSVRRWTQTSPKNLNMNSSDDKVFVRIMYFLDEMICNTSRFFLANVAIFTMGLHTGWPGPSLPKILSDEFPYDVSNEAGSYITIVGNLGTVFGGLIGSLLLDRIGRRRTMLLIALPQFISFFLIAMSYYVFELLYVARVIGGLGEGMCLSIIPLYVAEIADASIRGVLSTMISLTVICGILFVNIVGSYVAINIAALSFLVFPIIFFIAFWKMPESPYFLLMKNKPEQAERILKFLRRKSNVDEELNALEKDVKRQMSESGNFRDIFTVDTNRTALILAIGTRLVQQLTGISAFSLYIQILLSEATQVLSPQIGSSIVLFVQLIMMSLSTLFVDKWGRKPLLLASAGACFINLFIQAIYFVFKEYTNVDVSVIDWFPLVMTIIFIIVFSLGLGVVVTTVSSEVFSASIKSKAMCLVNVAFALSMMGTTKFYQVTADEFGLTVPYFSFALTTFLGVLFIYFWLPETKGKTLEEIQQRLKKNKKTEAP
jgi:sugar porter (SP) family MFS transporter